MMIPLALVLLRISLGPGQACSGPSNFEFRAVRIGDNSPVKGLQLRIEWSRPGQNVPNITEGPTEAGGDLVIALRDACPGDFVTVNVTTPGFHLVYPPPQRRTPLGRGDAVVLVVCKADADCTLETREAVNLVTTRLLHDLRNVNTDDRAAMLQQLKDYLSNSTVDSRQVVAVILRKQRMVQTTSEASRMLNGYMNAAQELRDRFNRHAVRAITYPDTGPLQQINDAIRPYNAAFDALKQGRDAYAVEPEDVWPPAQKAAFASLVDEALQIHQRIHDLNALKDLINDVRRKVVNGSQADEAIVRVRDGVAALTSDVQSRLTTLKAHVGMFLDSREQELLR